MSEYPSYLIHYGIQGQKWGFRRFQYEDGTLTPEGIKRYSKLLDKSNSPKGYSKLQKFEKKADIYNRNYGNAKYLSNKERIKLSKRYDNKNIKTMEDYARTAADKRQEGKNPINEVRKYANTSLDTAIKLVNGSTGKEAEKVIQSYVDVTMRGLNNLMFEVGDFNSYNEHPTKYNMLDYTYDTKNKKLHQKSFKKNSDWE